jgi:large subunit ribosomal protein L18e
MIDSNPFMRKYAVLLERQGKAKKAPIWITAAKMLGRPTASRVEVNLSRINRLAPGTPILVPGKVLGSGSVERKLIVGAFSFSTAAQKKIEGAGGSALTLPEFVKKFPEGSGVLLVE